MTGERWLREVIRVFQKAVPQTFTGKLILHVHKGSIGRIEANAKRRG